MMVPRGKPSTCHLSLLCRAKLFIIIVILLLLLCGVVFLMAFRVAEINSIMWGSGPVERAKLWGVSSEERGGLFTAAVPLPEENL